jgi:hypothetical protein
MQSSKDLITDKLLQKFSLRGCSLKLVFQINILIQKNPSKIDFERAGLAGVFKGWRGSIGMGNYKFN